MNRHLNSIICSATVRVLRWETNTEFWYKNLEVKRNLRDLDVDGRILNGSSSVSV
jgi:hypothetical protein